MLILSRKQNETIRIGDDISLRIVSVDGGTVKIGIDAPLSISVHRGEVYDRHRGEVYDRIQKENRMAAQRPAESLQTFAQTLRTQKKRN